MNRPPFPELDELLTTIGAAGRRLDAIGASEGGAGNISVCLRGEIDIEARFPETTEIELPLPVPELAEAVILASGSGSRLRQIGDDPAAHLACITVHPGGRTGSLHRAPQRRFQRITSEFNSHLAVHHDQLSRSGGGFSAVVHAQPLRLTYLSHVPRYQDPATLNARLLRWQPETILNLPEGMAVAPFCVPGSGELMAATVAALRRCRLVVWVKHGVMARSDVSVLQAVDRIEYAEAAARYEVLNLSLGEIAAGLSAGEIRAICQAYHVQQNIF